METIEITSGKGVNANTYVITIFTRAEFCTERFDYNPGEHALFAGPTQNGKTTLAFELAEQVISPELPIIVAVSKPRDPTTTKFSTRLGLERIDEWPPPPVKIFGDKPSGHVLWPKFGNLHEDAENCARVHRSMLAERYSAAAKSTRRKPVAGILMMDDTVTLSKVMKLDREMTTYLTMAGAMDLGMWVFVQKPTGAGETALWAYGNSEHVFLFSDPDRRNQQRYDEIGGFDPNIVTAACAILKPYQCLYLRRTGRQICIVDSK
jgi:hypothetical protein